MFHTIDGFETLTAQQIFDMSAKHILSTGKPSMVNNTCVYSGSGCGASIFLKEESRPVMDNIMNDDNNSSGWVTLTAHQHVSPHQSGLVMDLQNAHDNAAQYVSPRQSGLVMDLDEAFMTHWKRRMFSIANQYGLNTDVFPL